MKYYSQFSVARVDLRYSQGKLASCITVLTFKDPRKDEVDDVLRGVTSGLRFVYPHPLSLWEDQILTSSQSSL